MFHVFSTDCFALTFPVELDSADFINSLDCMLRAHQAPLFLFVTRVVLHNKVNLLDTVDAPRDGDLSMQPANQISVILASPTKIILSSS